MATRNPNMICPHCQTKGNVSTERTKMKQGVSGGDILDTHIGSWSHWLGCG